MPQQEPRHGDPLGPLAVLRRFVPVETAATSHRLGWSSLEAARCRAMHGAEFQPPRRASGPRTARHAPPA